MPTYLQKLTFGEEKIGLVTRLVIPCGNLPKGVSVQPLIQVKLELLEPLQECSFSFRLELPTNTNIQRRIFKRQPVPVSGCSRSRRDAFHHRKDSNLDRFGQVIPTGDKLG